MRDILADRSLTPFALVQLYNGQALGTRDNPVTRRTAERFFELPPEQWMGWIVTVGHAGGYDGLRRLPTAPDNSQWVEVFADSRNPIGGCISTGDGGYRAYQLRPAEGAERRQKDKGPSGLQYSLTDPFSTEVRDGESIQRQWTTREVIKLVDEAIKRALSETPEDVVPHRGSGLTFALRGGDRYLEGLRVESDLLDSEALAQLEDRLRAQPELAFLATTSLEIEVSVPHPFDV